MHDAIMSRLKERDEALKLDESFKETIERVRPYVIALGPPEDTHLCRVWLEKLCGASSQRSLRNQYLLELCGYLRSGRIGGIFGKPPQNGPLGPLPRFCAVNGSSSMSQLSDTSNDAPKSFLKHRNKIFSGNNSRDSTRTNRGIAESISGCAKTRLDRNQLSTCRRRIESLNGSAVRELQIENECLKRNLSWSRHNCKCKENSETVDQLTVEITTLRTKLVEVNRMKEALEKNHREFVEQYKSAMTRQLNEFNARLCEAHGKNVKLDEKVTTMNSQLEKIIREKEEQVITIEQSCNGKIESARLDCETLLADKDRELLLKDKIINNKDAELASREKLDRDEILLLKDKIQDLKNKLQTNIEDEGKLQSFLKEQCNTIKDEFMKMRSEMESGARTENQGLVDKISSLKMMIKKLTKSKDKLSIEFEKNMSNFVKKKDSEIKSLQLRLHKQHSELSATLSTEKQCELDGLVRLLEERYRELLAATDASAGKQRQSFLKKITFLENQVTCMKNNLAENDVYV